MLFITLLLFSISINILLTIRLYQWGKMSDKWKNKYFSLLKSVESVGYKVVSKKEGDSTDNHIHEEKVSTTAI